MLEGVRKSYIQSADAVVPNWRSLDVNTLCNLYIQHEGNVAERNGYFSAIILKKWGYIGRHYMNSKASGFSIEQCYDMVVDAVMYILKMRKWLDPENKLYGDKNAPDKCLNRCIFSARQRDYYLSNRDKRRANFGKTSLDKMTEDRGDHNDMLKDPTEELSDSDNFIQSLAIKNLITRLFQTNKVIEALILDNIINDDCFTTRVGKKAVVVEGEVETTKTYSENFKFGKLINNLHNYNKEVLVEICNHYGVDSAQVTDVLPILTRDKNKLTKIVKAMMGKLSKDKVLRESLCC